MTDIVERLCLKSETWATIGTQHPAFRDQDLTACLREAANEIEQLRAAQFRSEKAEIGELRAANATMYIEIERLRRVEENHDRAIERAEQLENIIVQRDKRCTRLEAEIERLREESATRLRTIYAIDSHGVGFSRIGAHNIKLEAEIERLRAALLTCPCPGGGYTGIPPDIEPTIGACIAAGVCGCCYGDVLDHK